MKDRICRFHSHIVPGALGCLALVIAACGKGDESLSDTCTVNADCADSNAARLLATAKCGFRELYCVDRTCHGDCAQPCTVVRTDTNPCEEGAMCAPPPRGDPTQLLCTMLPIPCAAVEDCPGVRLPLSDGGQAEWTCSEGECT